MCENPIRDQRAAFSLSFSDFISEKATTKQNINTDIELLLLLFEPNFEILKTLFIDALLVCFILSENPERISFVIFTIIEKVEESKFVKQILHLLQDKECEKSLKNLHFKMISQKRTSNENNWVVCVSMIFGYTLMKQ